MKTAEQAKIESLERKVQALGEALADALVERAVLLAACRKVVEEADTLEAAKELAREAISRV